MKVGGQSAAVWKLFFLIQSAIVRDARNGWWSDASQHSQRAFSPFFVPDSSCAGVTRASEPLSTVLSERQR